MPYLFNYSITQNLYLLLIKVILPIYQPNKRMTTLKTLNSHLLTNKFKLEYFTNFMC